MYHERTTASDRRHSGSRGRSWPPGSPTLTTGQSGLSTARAVGTRRPTSRRDCQGDDEQQDGTDARNRHRATHVYPLADLAYSVCFSEHQGQLFAHLRLNVFSDLGGAGVSLINGTIVKVRKGVGAYDQEELAARAHFQRGFLTALRRHPDLGATALHPFLVSI
jgi:hypothetical protein